MCILLLSCFQFFLFIICLYKMNNLCLNVYSYSDFHNFALLQSNIYTYILYIQIKQEDNKTHDIIWTHAETWRYVMEMKCFSQWTCQHNSLDFIYTSGSNNDIFNLIIVWFLSNDMLLKKLVDVVCDLISNRRNPELLRFVTWAEPRVSV